MGYLIPVNWHFPCHNDTAWTSQGVLYWNRWRAWSLGHTHSRLTFAVSPAVGHHPSLIFIYSRAPSVPMQTITEDSFLLQHGHQEYSQLLSLLQYSCWVCQHQFLLLRFICVPRIWMRTGCSSHILLPLCLARLGNPFLSGSTRVIGLAKKFICVFHNILWKNSNNHFSQPSNSLMGWPSSFQNCLHFNIFFFFFFLMFWCSGSTLDQLNRFSGIFPKRAQEASSGF